MAIAYPQSNDDNAFENEFKPYLYWPPAAIMVLMAIGSYAVGMYFS